MSAGDDVKVMGGNGLQFGYLSVGDAAAPLALCLHGFPDSARTWRHLLPVLADLGYHAVAPFMRGYAPTEVPADGAYQLGALVADAVALHDAFGADDRAVLIGHDWGAMTAYGAIACEPGRWRRAVTLAVPPLAGLAGAFFDYEQLRRSFYIFLFQTPLAEVALAAGDLAFVDGLWRDWSPGYGGASDAALAKDCIRDPANLAAAVGYYRAMLDPSRHQPRYAAEQAATDGSSGVGCPVLYLHGARDGCLGAELAGPAAAFLPPGSRHELIEEAGHFLHLERPDLVNELILGWLRD
ncbi:MAG TPA: alpha/beta hydrolase [Streptosporangiaceae bacterium]|jgi:pimeloyl-ACP methyl ester carboxylesterase